MTPHKFTAIVTKSTGSWYTVLDPESGDTYQCRIRGVFRLRGSRSTNPVVVGDRVVVVSDEDPTKSESQSVITEILPRSNYIIRRASNLSKESHIIAANIDTAYLVVTLFAPATPNEFIDRFLVTAAAYHIPATIVLNKIDLMQSPDPASQAVLDEALETFRTTYRLAGYEVVEVSAAKGTGIEALRERMVGRTSLLAGNSGVGKSTIINAIAPTDGPSARTGAISDYHHKGRHTTTFSEIYMLDGGGMLIDTPGIKGFGLVDIDHDELARYFPDLFAHAPQCQFHNCTHTHEPGCGVLRALGEGLISESRFESYLKMLEEDETSGKYRK